MATKKPKSMAEFCHDVWKETDAGDTGTTGMVFSPLRESSSSQNSRVSAEPTGKENAPSQQSLLGQSPVTTSVEETHMACPGAETQHAAFALSTMAFSSSLG
jgi:hypothetical protein